MESAGRKRLEISKAIETVSFIAEEFKKRKEMREELESNVFGLSNRTKVIKKRRNDKLVENASLDKIIAEQQITITKLENAKKEIEIYHTEILMRDDRIKKMEEEIVQLTFKQTQEKLAEQDYQKLKDKYIKTQYEQMIQRLEDEKITVISEIACRTEELNNKLLKAKAEKTDKTNALVLEYEKILQRAFAQSMCIKDAMQGLIKNSSSIMSVYLKRTEELEQTEDKRINTVAP